MYSSNIGTIVFVSETDRTLYADLERSTSIFYLRSRSKGDLTRLCCIPFDAPVQDEHFKTYPMSLSQSNQKL